MDGDGGSAPSGKVGCPACDGDDGYCGSNAPFGSVAGRPFADRRRVEGPPNEGVAVGCGWQALVAYINIGCYYFIGVPLGALLGFKFDYGIKGLWGGMIGGTLIQTIILLWITFRTDWEKEVEEARRRLDKWDDAKQPLLANVQR
ncbi:protein DETOXIFICATION 39-like [Triticum urartu]|uniref:protein DETOXIFICATION 39-like n=1 Tax=Triticum urartu TaxID=4572 RepID=UPI002043473B|nr:protein DETOXIFICATION 39-like [Triticum urartu]